MPSDANGLPSVEDLHRAQETNADVLTKLTAAEGDPDKDSKEETRKPTSPSPLPRDSNAYTTVSLEELTAQAESRKRDFIRTTEANTREGVSKPNIKKVQEETPQDNNKANSSKVAAGKPVPIALGKPRTSDHIIALHQFVHKFKLPLPEFEYSENSTTGAGTFTVLLKLGINVNGDTLEHGGEELVLRNDGPFRSKKEAKETISGEALHILKDKVELKLKEKEAAGTTAHNGGPQAQNNAGAASAVPSEPPLIPGENPIGLLLEYCSTKTLPQPTFQLYELAGPLFSCELTIQLSSSADASPPTSDSTSPGDSDNDDSPEASPGSSGSSGSDTKVAGSQTIDRDAMQDGAIPQDGQSPQDDQPQFTEHTFGTRLKGYPSKKAAKTRSAALAITHLRDNGFLSASSSRKRMRTLSSSLSFSVSADNTTSPADTTTENPATLYGTTTIQSQMHHLRIQLGLGNLEYKLTPTPEGSAYYRGYVIFPSEGPKGAKKVSSKSGLAFAEVLQGRVGELGEEVLGKKAAKEAIARGVVGVLRGELERRGEVAAAAGRQGKGGGVCD